MSDKPVMLVTGASGLIGSALVRRMADRYAVVGADMPGRPHPHLPAHALEFNLTDKASVLEGLAQMRRRFGPKIASVIHLAAYYDFSGAPSPLYEQVNVRGTERLLQSLRELDFSVDQLIFSSTMLVHAPCGVDQKINEQWPLDPKWDHPRTKVCAENLVAVEHGRIPALILRIAGVYTDSCQSLPLTHQIQRLAEKRLEGRFFPGDLTHGQSFVHLDDLIDAIDLGIERRKTLARICVLLIGEDKTLSYGKLQEEFARLLWHAPWKTEEIPKSMAKAGSWVEVHLPWGHPFIQPWMIDLCDDNYTLDIARATNDLGWTPRRSLLQTLPKMISALRQDPARWYRDNLLDAPPAELHLSDP